MSRCMNCGEEGPHFVPPSLGEEGFFHCKAMGHYYLALKFADYRGLHTTLVYYGDLSDSEVGQLAAYVDDVFSVSDATRFDMRFDQQTVLQKLIRLEADRDDLPEWVQELAMMSEAYEHWKPFVLTSEDPPLTMQVSGVALMSGGEEFFKWEFER